MKLGVGFNFKYQNNIKKIAFKCTSIKDTEIINILISLVGNNPKDYSGNCINCYYFINNYNIIDMDSRPPKGYTSYTIKEYKQLNMEKRNIQIDLNTAKEWYNQGGELKKVALQAFTEKELKALPSSWEEYCGINPYINKDKILCLYTTDNKAKQFLTLNKLLQIKDYYNQGWKPDWENINELKHCIYTEQNQIDTISFYTIGKLFTFKTKELRDQFFENFEKELNFIKEFL